MSGSLIGGVGMGVILFLTVRFWPIRDGASRWLIGTLVYIGSAQVIRAIVGSDGWDPALSLTALGVGIGLLVVSRVWWITRRRRA